MSEERVARVATAIFNEIFPRTTGRAIPATMVGEYAELAKAAIAAHEAALAAAGLVIVPRQPTEAMIEAVCAARGKDPTAFGGADDCGVLPKSQPVWRTYGEEAAADYCAMVDATLAPPPSDPKDRARRG